METLFDGRQQVKWLWSLEERLFTFLYPLPRENKVSAVVATGLEERQTADMNGQKFARRFCAIRMPNSSKKGIVFW